MLKFLRKLNHFFAPQKLEVPAQLPMEELVSDEIFNHYSYIISSRIQYFNDLPFELKHKFVNRVHQYIGLKQFHYIGLEPKEEIPVLTASSAIQVTFGLKSYLMQHFKNIYMEPPYQFQFGINNIHENIRPTFPEPTLEEKEIMRKLDDIYRRNKLMFKFHHEVKPKR